LEEVARMPKKWRRLILPDPLPAFAEELEALGCLMPRLLQVQLKLRLLGLAGVSVRPLASLISGLRFGQSVTAICVARIGVVDRNFLCAVFESCPLVRRLDISFCVQLNGLSVSDANVRDRLAGLESLQAEGVPWCSAFVSSLCMGVTPRMSRLVLDCFLWETEDLRELQGAVGLQVLHLFSCRFVTSATCLREARFLPNLQSFVMTSLSGVPAVESVALVARLLGHLSHARLQAPSLSGLEAVIGSGRVVARFLRLLDFSGCPELRDEDLRAVCAVAPSLKVLLLCGCVRLKVIVPFGREWQYVDFSGCLALDSPLAVRARGWPESTVVVWPSGFVVDRFTGALLSPDPAMWRNLVASFGFSRLGLDFSVT